MYTMMFTDTIFADKRFAELKRHSSVAFGRCLLAAAIAVSIGTAEAQLLNGSGTVVTALPDPLTVTARSIAVQADGALVVAGNTAEGANDLGADFLLLRYAPDGTLDQTFGHDGVSRVSLGEKRDIAYAVLQQADGKLVAAGGSEGGPAQGSFALVRYLADGSLDPSFAGTGAVITPINIGNISALALLQQRDGKLLAAGHYNANGFALVRYNEDGSLDSAFGQGNGYVVTALGGRCWGTTVAELPDGRLVVAGHRDDRNAITLLRYWPDGNLDESFGDRGVVTTTLGEKVSQANSLLVQADGKLVVAGTTSQGGLQLIAVLRYLPDGTPDSGFGKGGVVTLASDAGANARSVVQQTDGSLVVAARRQNADKQLSGILVHLLPDGSVDTLFGENGIMAASLASGASGDILQTMLQQQDGRLVLVSNPADHKAVQLSFITLPRQP
jgi:uncharacterized delta-60 repeat protein